MNTFIMFFGLTLASVGLGMLHSVGDGIILFGIGACFYGFVRVMLDAIKHD
jgi:hypothetical protein